MFGPFEITSIRLYTPLRNQRSGLHGVYNLVEVISSWTNKYCNQSLNTCNTSYYFMEVVTKRRFFYNISCSNLNTYIYIYCCSFCVFEEMKVCQVFKLFVIFKMTVMFTCHYPILINDLDGLRPLTCVHKLSHSPLTWIWTLIPWLPPQIKLTATIQLKCCWQWR